MGYLSKREKSTFYGITIIHPHSGKIGRSPIETALIHYAHAYDHGSRAKAVKWAVEQIKRSHGIKGKGAAVVMEDVGYVFRVKFAANVNDLSL